MGRRSASSSPKRVAQELAQSCPAGAKVVLCSAPPCKDFSLIRRDTAPRTEGSEGCKFVNFASWMSEFLKLCQFEVVALVENVVPSAGTQEDIDRVLKKRSFLCDAAAWGLISRPRLWWTNVLEPPHPESKDPPQVLTGLARWRKWNRQWELITPICSAISEAMRRNLFLSGISSRCSHGSCSLPVFDNASTIVRGSASPSQLKRTESPDTMFRWQNAGQQYPLWHYRTQALVRIAGQQQSADAATREFLHDFPSGYTFEVSERSLPPTRRYARSRMATLSGL